MKNDEKIYTLGVLNPTY